jgi:hypothetical protein
MSHFNLEKWVLAQWQYPTISRPEPWGKQSEWSEKLIIPQMNVTTARHGRYSFMTQMETRTNSRSCLGSRIISLA